MNRSIPRRLAVLAVAAGLSTFAVACGGDDESPAPPAKEGSVPAAETSGLKAETAELLKRPVKIGITEPIEGGVPKGKTIAFLQCGLPDCAQIGDILEKGAALLDWKIERVQTGLTPETIKAGWAEALRRKPDGIIQTGSPEPSIYADEIAQAKDGKIPVAAFAELTEGPEFLVSVQSASGYVEKMLQAAAKYVAAEFGEGKTLVVDVPGIQIIQDEVRAFKEQLATSCPKCEVDTVEIPPASIGKDAAAKIANHIQGNPGTDSLVLTLPDVALGLPAALASVGIQDLPTVMAGNNPATLQLLEKGEGGLKASVQGLTVDGSYRLLDALARHFKGMPVDVDKDATAPFWIIPSSDVPSERPLPMVSDVEKQFAALWGVG